MEKNKRNYPVLIFVLALLVSLIVGFRVFLMDYFIEPIALMCWTAWRMITSVDQQVYWAMFIVLCAIFILYNLLPVKEAVPRSLYAERQILPGRVEQWQRLMNDSADGPKEAEQFRRSLNDLVMRIIAKDEGTDPVDIDSLAAEGRDSLPPEIQVFLFADESRKMTAYPKWLRKWLSKPDKREIAMINETLRWMENELEIDDGK